MSYEPQLSDYMQALEQKRVFACEDEHFIGFKYNAPTVYSHDWDDVTLNARGIAFDKVTGEIVARPFFKFFNYQELINGEGRRTDILNMMENHGFKFDRTQTFRVMDKLDGSLGIAFYDKYASAWRVKTGGSFESAQAIWATKWLNEHVMNGLCQGFTYCYEILMKDDVHPISYDKEELVLLGIISNKTGVEMPLDYVRQIGEAQRVRVADVIEFSNFDEVLPYATSLPPSKEGVVVTFANGFKVKMKGHEFLALQKKFHSITKEMIWNNFNYKNLEEPFSVEFITSVPEEMTDMHDYIAYLKKEFTTRYLCTVNAVGQAIFYEQLSERKDVYTYIVNNLPRDLITAAMKLWTVCAPNKLETIPDDYLESFAKTIWQSLKP